MRPSAATLLLFLLAILSGAQASLQVSSAQAARPGSNAGVLTGTVTDQSGAVVVNAEVTARNAEGASFSTATDGNGKFKFSALQGVQVITVKQRGFAESKTENVGITPGESSDIAVVLQLSGEQNSVTVTADHVEQIETETGAVSNTLTEQQVQAFPTNGRNMLSFVSLAAGVSNQTGQDELQVGVVGSAKFAVNGGRTEYNSFLVDGSDVLNTDIAASHGESTLMVYPSIDAIKELKVMTSNYGAEYGRSASGTVVVSLKSGSDHLHGSAYDFIRNEFFNARNYFDHQNKAPLYRRNNFGGSFGGPIFIPHVFNEQKDKTFFFVSEEVRKEKSPQQFSQGVPSDAERGYNTYTGGYGTVADFSDVCPADFAGDLDPLKYPDCPATGGATFSRNQFRISDTARALLAAGLIPRANATTGCISSIGSCYVATISPDTDYRQDLGRLDQTLPLRTHLSLSVVHDHWQAVVPLPHWAYYGSSFPTVQNEFKGPGLSAVAHFATQIGKTGINDVSVGLTLQRISLTDLPGPGVNLDRAGLNGDGVPLGSIFDNNGGKLPALVFGGNNREYGGVGFSVDTSFEPWNNSLATKTFRETLNYFWKKHTVQLGIQVVNAQRSEKNSANGGNTGNVQGALLFSNTSNEATSRNSFADFLLGDGPSSPAYIQAFAQDNTQFDYKESYWTIEPYFQDDYKINSRLTLNLGLRMSLFYNWEPAKRNVYNWDPSHFNASLLSANGMSINQFQGYLQNSVNGTPVPFSGSVYNLLYNGLVQCGVSGVPSSCQTSHLVNPAPRVGFAWDITGAGHYSLRGGYGVFWEHGTGSEANSGSLLGNPPYVLSVQQGSPVSYALIGHTSPQSNVAPAFPLNMTAIPGKTIWPYVQQWSLGLEAQLPSSTFLSVFYVGSKGTHLAEESQANQLHAVTEGNNPFPRGTPILNTICNSRTGPIGDPTSSYHDFQTGVSVNYKDNPSAFIGLYAACNGTPDTYSGGVRTHLGVQFDPNSLRPMQGVGRVQTIRNDASSVYHSMQMSVRRNRGPLELALSYTYSHSIDSASDRFESTFLDTFDLAANRASSSFDQRHLVNVSYVYQLPLMNMLRAFHNRVTCSDTAGQPDSNCPADQGTHYDGPSKVARLALSDWSLSGILLFQTGSPFSIVNGQSPNGVSVQDNAGLLIGSKASSYADVASSPISCTPLPRQLNVSGTFGPMLGNTCRFQAPRGLTQGNTGRNYLNNPSRIDLDVAFVRNFKSIGESNIKFRAEVFNAFNNTQFMIYDSTRGNTAANTISCYGDIYSGFSAGAEDCQPANAFLRPVAAHRPRTMQFGLKWEF